MRREVLEVDHERGIIRCTTLDERWYAMAAKDAAGETVYEYVPSVTWIAGHYPKGVGFYKWIATKGWDEAEEIRVTAGDKGSKVHMAIKSLLCGNVVSMGDSFTNPTSGELEELTVQEWEAILSFADWCAEAKPEVIDCEYVIWSQRYHYAGMVDLKCRLSDEYLRKEKLKPGGVWIIDFKTSQDVWPSHELQVSAYRKADGASNARAAILQVGYRRNRRKYKFSYVENRFELFLAARKIWAHETAGVVPLQRDMPMTVSLNLLSTGAML
jgi:hypothetical protein